MRKAEISSGKHNWKEARQREKGRIKQTEHRAQEKHKQYRRTRRQAEQREEDLHVTREGMTYVAGRFDETQLRRAGEKRKIKSTLVYLQGGVLRCTKGHFREL